jgi:hypothetical protein
MFCRVLKKGYHDSVTFGTKRWGWSLQRSFFPATLGEIIQTYGAGRSFVTSPKDVNKNELYSSNIEPKKDNSLRSLTTR